MNFGFIASRASARSRLSPCPLYVSCGRSEMSSIKTSPLSRMITCNAALLLPSVAVSTTFGCCQLPDSSTTIESSASTFVSHLPFCSVSRMRTFFAPPVLFRMRSEQSYLASFLTGIPSKPVFISPTPVHPL